MTWYYTFVCCESIWTSRISSQFEGEIRVKLHDNQVWVGIEQVSSLIFTTHLWKCIMNNKIFLNKGLLMTKCWSLAVAEPILRRLDPTNTQSDKSSTKGGNLRSWIGQSMSKDKVYDCLQGHKGTKSTFLVTMLKVYLILRFKLMIAVSAAYWTTMVKEAERRQSLLKVAKDLMHKPEGCWENVLWTDEMVGISFGEKENTSL